MNAPEGSLLPPPSVRFGIIAIGCSTGGLTALQLLLGELPADFPVPIVIVQHMAADNLCLMPCVLNGYTPLSVRNAHEGDILCPGSVYVALPDCHLIVTAEGTLSLTDTEKVRYSRPSVDVLFVSVAKHFQEKAIGIVLTGAASDGAEGIRAIKEAGGLTIAQNEATSQIFGMPRAAIETGKVDIVLPLCGIAPVLMGLCKPRR